jgi:protein-disulfide isomerase
MLATIKVIGTEGNSTLRQVQAVPRQVRVLKLDAFSAEAQQYGLLVTPTLVINDHVVSRGKVLTADQIERALKKVMMGG